MHSASLRSTGLVGEENEKQELNTVEPGGFFVDLMTDFVATGY